MSDLRILRIVLFFSLSALLYLYLGTKIVIRRNDKYSRYLSAFYFSQSTIFILNIVYAFIFVEHIVYFLFLVLLYIGSIGFGSLLIFNGLLYFSRHDFFQKLKIRVYYLLSYATILLGIFFIPNGVVINMSTDWRPVYSFPFMLYIITVNFVLAGVPLIILSIKTYISMEAPDIKRKFLSFCIALYLYFFVLTVSQIFNYLNMPSLNLLYFLLSIIMLPSAYFMYYGTKGFGQKDLIKKYHYKVVKMWTPFEVIPKSIKISKKSLIQFAKNQNKFLMNEVFKRYLESYKIINTNSKVNEPLIRQQIEEKVQILIKEKIFRKEGNFIVLNMQ